MRIAIVVGAGASLAQGEFFRASRGRDRNPPLDYTFFEKVRALQIGIPDGVRAYAQRVPSRDPFDGANTGARMEEFLKDLYYDLLDVPGDFAVRTAYTQLVEIYVRVIRETTNWICERSRLGGPIGRLLARAGDLAHQVSVITFNHDLIIENEILKRSRLRKRWCVEQGYGLFSGELEYSGPGPGSPAFPPHSDDCDHQNGITILKLHGSLNWYMRLRGETPTANQLTGRGSAPQIFVTTRRTVPTQFRQHISASGPGRKTFATWPIVIPPVYAKESLIKSYVATPWDEARTQLLQADAIVFFGYSLPGADIAAERLFQRAIKRNSKATVTLINPSSAAAARFAALMIDQLLVRFPSVGSFLRVGTFELG
jgi:hypothetical protein